MRPRSPDQRPKGVPSTEGMNHGIYEMLEIETMPLGEVRVVRRWLIKGLDRVELEPQVLVPIVKGDVTDVNVDR